MTQTREELRERVKRAIASQKRPTVTVLSSLLAIQDDIGYIPDEAIEEVAIARDTTTNAVYGVASFYPNFRFTPPGAHHVEVCWGPTCHLQGAPHILRAVLDDLNLEGEGDTGDGRISLKFNTCLGACQQAPVVSIDHHMTGHATPDSTVQMISRLTADGPH